MAADSEKNDISIEGPNGSKNSNDGVDGGIVGPDAKEQDQTSVNPRHEGDILNDSNDAHDKEVSAAVSEPQEQVHRQHAPSTISRTRSATKVPRIKRRGFLAQVTVIPEVEQPYEYHNRVKWTLTTIVALSGALAPMGSAIFFPALPEMAKEFDTPATIVNLAVALYMLAMSIFPLWWSAFSETLGRRNIYLTSFILALVFNLLTGLSVNITMLIIMRILSGGAAASVQAVGAGTIADMWEPRERGRAMSLFYLGPLTGPLLGPIVGGALSFKWGWRSTAWLMTVYSALVVLLLIFCLPETLPRKNQHQQQQRATPQAVQEGSGGGLSRVSTTRSVQERTKSLAVWLRRCFVDPLQIVLYLRFPAVAVTVYFAAITFGALYMLNISVQSAYSHAPYNYSELIVGLLYLPSATGYFLASIFGGPWIDRLMIRAAERAGRYGPDGRLVLLPEDRMRENAWISATMYPAALIWYGWCTQFGVSPAAAMVANFFFGIGSMLVFSMATTMLTEFMPKKASNGVALNNFVRNIFSATGGVIAQPLINAMGHGWLFTMIGIIAWVTGNLVIFLTRRYSKKWRAQMDEALNS